MKILLIGKNGQLGWELRRTCPQGINLVTFDFPEIDLTSFTSIKACIDQTKPDGIINAAAYTAVDRAEQEKDLAFKINVEAVDYLSGLAKDHGMGFVQISTDFVFDGKNSLPYLPEHTPKPVSVYGQSKYESEKAVLKKLPGQALIIRTAWLYSSHGNNFVKTMLGLMKERKSLSVIDEQIGTPTWAFGLAHAIWNCMDKQVNGIHHWTDAGVASWYDFAVAIQEEGSQMGLVPGKVSILPIPASQFPTPAKRPEYGVLDKKSMWKATGIRPIHWRTQLRQMLKEQVK